MAASRRRPLRTAARAVATAALLAVISIAVDRPARSKASAGPTFDVPVRCDMQAACFIQNYVDAEAGPGARDRTCGPLTYDGHDGIDIRVPDHAAMDIAVLAAAPGTVRAVRDGEADQSVKTTGVQAVAGREAGNAVVIHHDGGWETQYSHLRRGSIAVRPGQRVETGAVLGLVGLSGKTEFPHLHFSARHQGIARDPFTGLAPGSGCGMPGRSLWSPAAQRALTYRAGGLLAAGFAPGPVDLESVLSGATDVPALSPDVPALVFWAASWGLRAGDTEVIRVFRPDGSVLSEATATVLNDKAQWLRYAGRKRAEADWPEGRYRGEYRIVRQVAGAEVTVVEVIRHIAIR